jgi:hypothetical protein
VDVIVNYESLAFYLKPFYQTYVAKLAKKTEQTNFFAHFCVLYAKNVVNPFHFMENTAFLV